ncbi:MAG: benzoate/H(+) symporter BenE family transporter [Halomonas sp.]
MCTSREAHREAHEDPGKRYVAGVANGVFYLVGGTFAGTIVALFTSLPGEFVAVLAGLALIGAITSNISAFAAEKEHLEASVITFIATASGVSFLGLGSAFWGVVPGGLAYTLLHRPLRRPGRGRAGDPTASQR